MPEEGVNKILSDDEEFRIIPLNMLAFRDIPRCDLTGARANVQLVTHFNQIYYGTEELAEQAWYGIIKKIDHLVAPLRLPAPIVGTAEEREKRKVAMTISKRSLIDFCLRESSNLLSIQKFQLAVPASIMALKFSKDVDGDRSLAVVEPYLQLSQAYFGMETYDKTEEFLSLARWIVLNSDDCSDRIRSRMYLLMGRVSTALGKFEVSKSEFSKSIFYMSRFQGAEAVGTSVGYYRLGDVFLAQGFVENALAFFDKVVDIWFKYLSALHNPEQPNDNIVIPEELESLSEEQLADGSCQLKKICETRKQLLGINHIATGEVQYTIGLFEFFLIGNDNNALGLIEEAQTTYIKSLGEMHPSTEHISSVLNLVRNQTGNKLFEASAELNFGATTGTDAGMGMTQGTRNDFAQSSVPEN